MVTLAYATLKVYYPDLSLLWYNIAACLVIFGFSFRQNKIVPVLGAVLTPLLLISLTVIVWRGVVHGDIPHSYGYTIEYSIFQGAMTGYQTMDLLATFFFAALVISNLGVDIEGEEISFNAYAQVFWQSVRVSIIAMTLLGGAYVGFAFLGAANS